MTPTIPSYPLSRPAPTQDMNVILHLENNKKRPQPVHVEIPQGCPGCRRFFSKALSTEQFWYDLPQPDDHDDGAAAGHLPANRANQPFRQAPPPHPMVALTPWMDMLARRPRSGPPTPPTAPTRPQTMMVGMGEFSPILALLVRLNTSSSSNRPDPARIHL